MGRGPAGFWSEGLSLRKVNCPSPQAALCWVLEGLLQAASVSSQATVLTSPGEPRGQDGQGRGSKTWQASNTRELAISQRGA